MCVCVCGGGGGGLNVCGGGGGGLNVCGGGGKFGAYSILHMFFSCNCAKIFYCISLQHS